jgi:exonuclease III
MRIIKVFASYVALAVFTKLAIAQPIYIGSFNVNSGRAESSIIAKQMLEHENIDIWGLSESAEDWPTAILPKLNASKKFDVIKGSTGIAVNRLQIFYNNEKLYLISHTELDEMNPNRRVRAPLVAKFMDIKTKQQFLFMVNHLYRKDNAARVEQAKQINTWVHEQELPVIAVGDYNFDLSPNNIKIHDKGFDELTKDNAFSWIQPSELFRTQCSKFNSILDFIFISDKVHYSNIYSTISYPNDNYCKMNKYSDHRPVTGMIDLV